MEKSRFESVGQVNDWKYRIKNPRVDNKWRKDLVKRAWLSIYTKGKKVNSRAVEQLLAPHSLVPTQVSHCIRTFIGPNIVIVEHILTLAKPTWI